MTQAIQLLGLNRVINGRALVAVMNDTLDACASKSLLKKVMTEFRMD
jgi:hypothetical protein